MARRPSTKTALARLFDTASVPMYVLDERRRIVYCNPALADWMGKDVVDIIGQRRDYHSEPTTSSTDAAYAGLCPPPEVFAGVRRSARVTVWAPDGERRRTAEFLPAGTDSFDCVGVIAVVELGDRVAATASNASDPAAGWNAVELHQQIRQLRRRIGARYVLDRLVGVSPAMRQAQQRIRVAVDSEVNVLVVGPQGSGREHVARTIHGSGQGDVSLPLVPLACPLLDTELLQTTVRALMQRCAELQLERPPSLLLLDVDQLSEDVQATLLGLTEIDELELRTLATARRGLGDLASQGQFRADLASALGTLGVFMPPLSDRVPDIPLLAQFQVEHVNSMGDKQIQGFSESAVEQLCTYAWPGNIDELYECVALAHKQTEGPLIGPDDLPKHIGRALAADLYPTRVEETIELDPFLGNVERELIRRAIVRAKGNKSQAARLLGISRARLLRRIDYFTLEQETDLPASAGGGGDCPG